MPCHSHSNTGGPQDVSTDGRPTYHMSKSLEVVNEAGKLLDKYILSYCLIKYTFISAWKIRLKFRNRLCRESWLPGPLTAVQPTSLPTPAPWGLVCMCAPHPLLLFKFCSYPCQQPSTPTPITPWASEHAQWWHNLPSGHRMWGRSLCGSVM